MDVGREGGSRGGGKLVRYLRGEQVNGNDRKLKIKDFIKLFAEISAIVSIINLVYQCFNGG
jgi:hypothetical protein